MTPHGLTGPAPDQRHVRRLLLMVVPLGAVPPVGAYRTIPGEQVVGDGYVHVELDHLGVDAGLAYPHPDDQPGDIVDGDAQWMRLARRRCELELPPSPAGDVDGGRGAGRHGEVV